MSNRDKLKEDINAAGRYLTTISIIFHQAVSHKAGLSGADHKYLDLLFHEGPMTAGRLAELAGLTSGAVTGIIDRLEKKGLVKRESDPDDRRKVLVVAQIDKAMKLMAPVFEPLQSDLDKFYDRFTDDQLKTIYEYIQCTNKFFHEKTKQLRDGGL